MIKNENFNRYHWYNKEDILPCHRTNKVLKDFEVKLKVIVQNMGIKRILEFTVGTKTILKDVEN